MTIDTNNLSNFRIELGILQEEVNKYNPPKTVKFKIPAIMGTQNSNQSIPNKSYNIMNKNNNLGISKTTTSDSISLELPKEYLIYYPEKFVPEGTLFIIGFVGGDITNAKVIGRFY